MSEIKDDVKVDDQVHIQVSIAVGPPRYKQVKVTAASGIFKGGVQYDKDADAIIEANAAVRLEANGEVEILGDADAPSEE